MIPLLIHSPIVVGTSLTITFVAATLGYFWCEVRKAEADAMLKREMILRGMTAGEIERVIHASADRAGKA
jgi:hypothetical protein